MITFFPVEVVLLRMLDGYQLHLTSESQHEAALRWFAEIGIDCRDIATELKTSESSYLRWHIRYLEFSGPEVAVLVRLRWT